MVCRENYARSAFMGWMKIRARALGHETFHDSEIQSSQHEFKHALDGMTPMTDEQQIHLMQSIIAEVEADPNSTDGEKYRPYTGRAGQTGIVTRLRQEIDTLRTGLDRNGRPISGTVKANTAADLASIMRMGSMLESASPAKENFLEMNARHRGISMDSARSEWNRLMNRTGDFSQISLTDGFRDNLGAGRVGVAPAEDTRPKTLRESLAMAGMTARDQDELGQSGRQRAAMAEMERRRLDALANRPSRPTLGSNTVVRDYVRPEGNYLKCDSCGQFGHDAGQCPNGDLVEVRAGLDQRKDALANAAVAARWRGMLNRSDDELSTELERLYPGRFDSVSAFREALGTQIEKITPSGEMTPKQIAQANKGLTGEYDAVSRQLTERGGTPSWIKTVEYAPHTGLLAITPHDSVRKDGTSKPARTQYRRVSPEEFEELMASPEPVGKKVQEMGLMRTVDESSRFESAADLEGAKTLHQCPTCGQFASMNAYHRCPVKGGPSEQHAARAALANQEYRQALREAVGELPARPKPSQNVYPSAAHQVIAREEDQTAVEGRLVTGAGAAVKQDVANNIIATPAVRAQFPGATVTGTVRVWNSTSQTGGGPVLSASEKAGGKGLACTCPQFRSRGVCTHVRGVAARCARLYGAAPAGAAVPTPNLEAVNGMSLDAPMGPHSRVSYATIRSHRSKSNSRFIEAMNKRPHSKALLGAPVATPPRDMNNNPISEPAIWQRAGEEESEKIDLNDRAAVVNRMRRVLSGRGPRISYSVRPADPNKEGILIDVQRQAKGTPAEASQTRDLRELFSIPANMDLSRGFYIPPTGSARHSALDRAYGDPQRLKQSSWVTTVNEATQERNAQARTAARDLA